jgi:hypothetical protein
MEAFEQFVALAMEAEGLLVDGPHKFGEKKQTKKQSTVEFQTISYEVDLIGMRRDRLVLATVKSFFGSSGVKQNEVMARGKAGSSGYKIINDRKVREFVIRAAAEKYGYETDQVELRLYAGKFMSKKGEQELRVWAAEQHVGGGPIGIYNVNEVFDSVRKLHSTTYRDNPVLMSLKVLEAAGVIDLKP